MARGHMSEAEYAALQGRASKSVRFSDGTVITKTAAARRKSTRHGLAAPKRRRREGGRNETDWLPTLAVIGGVVMLGSYIYGRSRQLSVSGYLGQSQQDASIGGQAGALVGMAVSAIVPIPGVGMVLGEIGNLIGGLFGPGVHVTPGGETYDAATYELHKGYFAVLDLGNQIRATGNLPAQPAIGFVGLGTPGCDALPDDPSTNCAQCNAINCGAVNAPLTGPYLASLLGNSSYASYTAESQMTQLQASGAYDQGIAMQAALEQHLQFVLDSLQSGTMHWVNGSIVPVDAATANVPVSQSYATSQGQPTTPPPPSYNAVQQVGPPTNAAPLGGYGYVVAGGMVFLAVLSML